MSTWAGEGGGTKEEHSVLVLRVSGVATEFAELQGAKAKEVVERLQA